MTLESRNSGVRVDVHFEATTRETRSRGNEYATFLNLVYPFDSFHKSVTFVFYIHASVKLYYALHNIFYYLCAFPS
jgi:hypothetical protein